MLILLTSVSCKKGNDNATPVPTAETFNIISAAVNGNTASAQSGVNPSPLIRLSFTAPVNRASVANGITLTPASGAAAALNAVYQNGDSLMILQPATALAYISKYTLEIKNSLTSQRNTSLSAATSISFITAIDSSDKFPLLTDNALLDKVQQQTFKYFWEFGHPVSGMARERNTSGDLVTTGGTGFGIMAMVTAVNRNFITRADGAARVLKITDFLLTNCSKYHGAFAHWLNGATGATIPFSTDDNGADLVETSYLMQGLITARQYFNTTDATETGLRNKINTLWNGVEWNWFRQGNQNVLYWHWSPDKAWTINAKVSGWNEALITYVMAASSNTSPIPKIVYDNGWARNSAMKNNSIYFGYQLPLGPALGGPLFFEHYSFMGINPNGLTDAYANYQTQAINHSKINYEYCRANPKQWYGYSNLCWGLTASDVPNNGYNANAPDNDIGVISPTAAVSSIPYTPTESMNALKFFYYKLGDKIWGSYGFADAFSLKDPWFATSTLAIDQGPIIVMIENYRTGLLWNLFTSAPEIKNGMKNLGFTAPYL
ncbi:MAG: Ig-like domain-containing protein [Ferruginibacter sp.]|nr:Ig-like domain-containing protein [Ferruginibacter sp.]